MTFRVKISFLLLAVIISSVGILSLINSHLILKDQEVQFGDFQSSLARSTEARMADAVGLLTEQLTWILKKTNHPLSQLNGALDAYLGGVVWDGDQRTESVPSTLSDLAPFWDGEIGVIAGNSLFTKPNFGLAVKAGKRKLIIYLDSGWLKNFNSVNQGAVFGLDVGSQIIWADSKSLDNPTFADLPQTRVSTTKWSQDELGVRYLVTTIPIHSLGRGQLVFAVPASKIFAVVRSSLIRTFFIAVILSLVSLVLAQYFAWGFSKPLKELEEEARRVSKGEFKIQLTPSLNRNDEFGSLAKAFVKMGSELEKLQKDLIHSERLSAIGQFSASVAHEIKNPLTGLLLTSEIAQGQLLEMKDKVDISELEVSLQHIAEDVGRANRKLSSLMKFARKDISSKELINLKEFLKQTVVKMSSLCKEQGILCKTEFPEGEIHVHGNRDNLNEVILNLTQNAIYAMKKSLTKELTVRVLKLVEKVVIEVQDTGCGIPEEVQTRLFEPFFTTKPIGEGTGLGLATCQGILKSHDGSIEIRSELNVGTTFSLSLPRVVSIANQEVA